MLGTEEINRITLEESLGKSPAKRDTLEMAEFRAKVKDEIAALKAQGREIQVPNE